MLGQFNERYAIRAMIFVSVRRLHFPSSKHDGLWGRFTVADCLGAVETERCWGSGERTFIVDARGEKCKLALLDCVLRYVMLRLPVAHGVSGNKAPEVDGNRLD